MRPEEQAETLRKVGLTPTIQRLAVLDWLSKTRQHPTADQVLEAVRRKYPSISRATVYNTLDALTKAGMILRLNVDPSVSRYDADLSSHAHFRCRVCGKVYDIDLEAAASGGVDCNGHRLESVQTYAYGVCAACLQDGSHAPEELAEQEKPAPSSSNLSPSGEEV